MRLTDTVISWTIAILVIGVGLKLGSHQISPVFATDLGRVQNLEKQSRSSTRIAICYKRHCMTILGEVK